jgi:hypothetical protein
MVEMPTPPRNRTELGKSLRAEGVPENLYSLDGGLWADRICLERRGRLWCVYHSERGTRDNETVFLTEAEACGNLYEKLTGGRMRRYVTEHPPASDSP